MGEHAGEAREARVAAGSREGVSGWLVKDSLTP